ncbi:MAG: CHAD domain-containing protein [Actinomycetota bacterium]|nr:CHAD domain-containing protein [Actinomycetota bacterium]MDQ5808478.1 CHAD domain-containing protein [Actinomycetota bacterium]
MKARKVKALDCDGALGDNAQRIVAVRLDELCAFVPRALDPDEVEALHDMRIAAKRLRYVLEVTEPCFGPYAPEGRRRTKELQDLLGEIHDCDVLVPKVLEVRESLPDDHPDRPGLEALAAERRERRSALFAEFLAFWTQLRREGFRARLEFAITERPAGSTLASP